MTPKHPETRVMSSIMVGVFSLLSCEELRHAVFAAGPIDLAEVNCAPFSAANLSSTQFPWSSPDEPQKIIPRSSPDEPL